MESIGQIIRRLRIKKNLLLREVSALTEIDSATLSKIERDERRPTKDQLLKLAGCFKLQEDDLMSEYLSEKIAVELLNEKQAQTILKLALKKLNGLNNAKK